MEVEVVWLNRIAKAGDACATDALKSPKYIR